MRTRISELIATIDGLKEDIKELQDAMKPLEWENKEFKSLLQQRGAEVSNLRKKLLDNEFLLYLAFGLFVVLMIAVAVVGSLAVRR